MRVGMLSALLNGKRVVHLPREKKRRQSRGGRGKGRLNR